MASKAIAQVQVGDWVRFYQNGKLVIGSVQYVKKKQFDSDYEICTDVGSVSSDYVEEVRSK